MSRSTLARTLNAEAVFLVVVLGLLAGGVVFSRDLTANSQLVPEILAAVGVPLVVLRFGLMLRQSAREAGAAAPEEERDVRAPGSLLVACAWVVGFLVVSLVAGLPLAIPLFVAAHMRQGGTGWVGTIGTTVVATGVMLVAFEAGLGIELYRGLFWPDQ